MQALIRQLDKTSSGESGVAICCFSSNPQANLFVSLEADTSVATHISPDFPYVSECRRGMRCTYPSHFPLLMLFVQMENLPMGPSNTRCHARVGPNLGVLLRGVVDQERLDETMRLIAELLGHTYPDSRSHPCQLFRSEQLCHRCQSSFFPSTSILN